MPVMQRVLRTSGPQALPMGAEWVRVRFAFRGDGVTEVRVFDPDVRALLRRAEE
jgi:hypothetical protein